MSRCVELRRARPLLGTFVEICARGGEEARLGGEVKRAFAAIARVQRLMSFHEPASDLSRLNRDAFRGAVTVHPWTWQVLWRAQEFSLASEGAFDITIAPLLSQWGYLPAGEATDDAGTFRDVLLLSRRRVRFARPLSIDLGGIAKGFAVDRAVESLLRAGISSGSVNAGGDLRVFGDAPQAVHLRDPGRPAAAAGVVALQNRAIATSGVYFSRKIFRGRAVSPLINATTRRPHTRHLSVAVSAPDCVTADALTKVVLARGDRSGALLRGYGADAVLLQRGQAPRVVTT